MSAPRLASLRPVGGPANLFRLVRKASLGLPTTSQAGAIWASARNVSSSSSSSGVLKSPLTSVNRQLKSRSQFSSGRPYGASAVAVVDAETQYYTSPVRQPGTTTTTHASPRNSFPPPLLDPPPWTALPPGLEDVISSSLSTPADIRSAFEASNSQPYHLARISTLENIWSIWSTQAEPSHWAWLAGQLGNVLAMEPHELAELEKGLIPMMQSIRGYAVIRLGQNAEARQALSEIRRNKSRGGMYAALIRAEAWSLLGKREEANVALGDAASAMASVGQLDKFSSQCIEMLRRLVELLKNEERWEDLLGVIIGAGGSLRTLLLGSTDKKSTAKLDKRVAKVWLDALAAVPDPAGWLYARLEGSNKDTRWMGTVFLTALARNSDNIDRCADLIDLAITQQLPFPPSICARLLSIMISAEEHEIAARLVNYLSSNMSTLPHSALSSLLDYHSHIDSAIELRRTWTFLTDRFEPTSRDKSNFLRQAIDLSNSEATEIQLRQFFGSSDHPEALAILLTSQITQNDIEGASETFEKLMAVRPSITQVNKMIGLYAANVDAASAVELFDNMANFGLDPNIASYTSLISLFANIRDVENARNVFRLMEDSGIVPDISAYSAVLNAEVEAGEWTAAAQRWTDIPPHLQYTSDIISVILKAYLLLAIPTERVIDIFRQVTSPTPYLYSLAMQSAVDNDDFPLAHSLLDEMIISSQQSIRSLRPSVFHYSIILHGYMRTGRRTESQAIYDSMLEKDIIPSSVTYGMIMSAFRQVDGQSGLEQAMQFAASVDHSARQLQSAPRGKGTGRENLFSPLVTLAGQAGQVGRAEEYMDLASPHQASIPLYTRLMDAYRLSGRTDSVLAIWEKAFELACSSTRRTASNISEGIATSRIRDNILCIPLSITLDSLASAGRYLDVRNVWDSVQKAGFGFDAQNYNHYATALARTGDIDRAFSIVENILIPRWEEVKGRRVEALRQAKYGLLPSPTDPPAVDDIPTPPPKRNRRHESRYGMRAITDGGPRRLGLDTDLLRAWRPSDTLWRPSLLTISVLEHAYSQVQDGTKAAWLALGSNEEDGDMESELGNDEERREVLLPNFGNVPIRDIDGEVKKTTPRAVAFRLNRKYSKVVALIMFHRRQRSSRRQE